MGLYSSAPQTPVPALLLTSPSRGQSASLGCPGRQLKYAPTTHAVCCRKMKWTTETDSAGKRVTGARAAGQDSLGPVLKVCGNAHTYRIFRL